MFFQKNKNKRSAFKNEKGQAFSSVSMEDVFEAHSKFVLRIVRRMGVREADVEDVAQDVFVIVHRKLCTFDNSKSMRAWLFGIVRNQVSDYRKKAFRRIEVSLGNDEIVDHCDSQETIAEQKEKREILERALERLDNEKREVFVLYQLEKIQMKEVAVMVGCPLQTAYSRLNAAREKIEEFVKRVMQVQAKETRKVV